MERIIYISTVGLEGKEKAPNYGPLQTGIDEIRPKDFIKVYILSESKKDVMINHIISEYPYLRSKVEFYKIDPFDYESLIKAILEIRNENQSLKPKFIVNLTGGTKIMSIGAFIGANLIGARVHYIKKPKDSNLTSTGNSELIDIKMPSIPIYELNPTQKLILFILANKPEDYHEITQSDLRRIIKEDRKYRRYLENPPEKEVSTQMISYHCEYLEKNELLTRSHNEKDRRANILTLTNIGRILANYLIGKK